MGVPKRKRKAKQNQPPLNKKRRKVVEEEVVKVEVVEEEEEEQNPNHTIISDMDDTLDFVRSVRDVPPAHYIFKIDSFSLISQLLEKNGLENYETSDFEAEGYKWKLLLYPNGNKKQDVNGYISLYLALSDTKNLHFGAEINVLFKFFILDQIRNKYLTLDVGRVSRFHALKTEIGISRLLSLITFNDPSNGYLIDDCCAFGAEVLVIKCEATKGESLSMMSEPKNATFTWKLDKFSELKQEKYYSEGFTFGGCQWKLELYPTGYCLAKGKSLSLYLRLHDYSVLRLGWKIYVIFKLSIKNQINAKHHEETASKWLCSSFTAWGCQFFTSLSDVRDVNNGFILNDTLIVEGTITFISVINPSA